MKRNQIPEAYRWLLSIAAPAVICALGWGQVIIQNHHLRDKAVQTYQNEQRQVLAVATRAIGHQLVESRRQGSTVGTAAAPMPMQALIHELNQTGNSKFQAFQIDAPSAKQNSRTLQSISLNLQAFQPPQQYPVDAFQPQFIPDSDQAAEPSHAFRLDPPSLTPPHTEPGWQKICLR